MHALALASLRASSLLRMTYQFLKTFASVSTYIAGNHSLHKTLIYGISRDGSKNFNIRTWEHMILGQLRTGARSTTYAALICNGPTDMIVAIAKDVDDNIPTTYLRKRNLFNISQNVLMMRNLFICTTKLLIQKVYFHLGCTPNHTVQNF